MVGGCHAALPKLKPSRCFQLQLLSAPAITAYGWELCELSKISEGTLLGEAAGICPNAIKLGFLAKPVYLKGLNILTDS